MISQSQQKFFSNFVKKIMQAGGNPIAVTTIASKIHEDPGMKNLWAYCNSPKMSAFISDYLPHIQLVGQTALGNGSCFAFDSTLPVTVPGDWIPWEQASKVPASAFPKLEAAKLSSSERDVLLRFLKRMIASGGGRVLSSQAGTACLADSSVSALRARFSSFRSMIAELAPEIVETSSGHLIEWDGSAPLFPQTPDASYPTLPDMDSDALISAVQELSSFAFMAPDIISKALPAMTGYSGKNAKNWLFLLALSYQQAKRTGELAENVPTTIRGKEERLCFYDSELTTEAGENIYVVLTQNPTEGYQPWILSEFCCMDDVDSVFSPFLEKYFSKRETPRVMVSRHLRLGAMVSEMNQAYENLRGTLEQLSDGFLLNEEKIKAVRQYLNKASSLRSSGLLARVNAEMSELTLESLQLLAGKNPSFSYLEGMEKSVINILDKVAEVLHRILSIDALDEPYPTGKCLRFFQKTGEEIRNGADMRDYLAQYRFWVDKLTDLIDFLWRGNKDLCEDISDEFHQVPSIMLFISDTLSKETSIVEELTLELTFTHEMLEQLEEMEAQIKMASAPKLPRRVPETETFPVQSGADVPDLSGQPIPLFQKAVNLVHTALNWGRSPVSPVQNEPAKDENEEEPSDDKTDESEESHKDVGGRPPGNAPVPTLYDAFDTPVPTLPDASDAPVPTLPDASDAPVPTLYDASDAPVLTPPDNAGPDAAPVFQERQETERKAKRNRDFESEQPYEIQNAELSHLFRLGADSLRDWKERLEQKNVSQSDSARFPESSVLNAQTLCWELLFQGEFALAREMAVTFRDAVLNRDAEPDAPVIADLAGFSLCLPFSQDNDAYYFQSCQTAIPREGLSASQRFLGALSAIVAAHRNRDVNIDCDALPPCLVPWARWLQDCRRENFLYLNDVSIEYFRSYVSRLNRIRELLERVESQIYGMENNHMNFVPANQAMILVCKEGELIGDLYAKMRAYPPERQAYGFGLSELRNVYQEISGIPLFKKNAGKINARDHMTDSFAGDLLDKVSRTRTNRITGNILTFCKKQICEFLQTVDQWLDVIKEPCEYRNDDPVSVFMQESRERFRQCREQVEAYAREREDAPVLQTALRRFLGVMDFMTGERTEHPAEGQSYLQTVLRLCMVPNLYIKKSESGDLYRYVQRNALKRIDFLIRVLGERDKSALLCLEEYENETMYSGVAALFDILALENPEEAERARQACMERLNERVESMKEEIALIKTRLDQISLCADELSGDYYSARSRVEQIEHNFQISGTENITILCRLVDDCAKETDALFERFLEVLKAKADGHNGEKWTDGKRKKFLELIERGRYADAIAWSLFPSVSENDDIESDVFSNHYFCKADYQTKESNLLDRNLALSEMVGKFEGAMMHHSVWGGFNFAKIPGSQADKRTQLINAWYGVRQDLAPLLNGRQPWMRSSQEKIREKLTDILSGIGWRNFTLREIGLHDPSFGGYLQFDMSFSMRYDRDTCPLPLYGSDSRSEIRFLCVAGGENNASDRLQYLLNSNDYQERPMIVLFFGVMSYLRRLELRNAMIAARSPYLVVDNLLLMSLCEQRFSILLPYLYQLSAPFSVQKMFTSQAGVVPQEMFYGRKDAKKSLGIGGDACFVYGGRQLGKTVLLKSIQYESHIPEQNQYVFYIELPRQQAVEPIHPERTLVRELNRRLSKSIAGLKKEYLDIGSMIDDVTDWLQANHARRFLLLLDEADEFLKADQKQDWFVVSRLDRAMNETERRFKVVFAGLNNTLRTTTDRNNPLGHFGSPVNIGPFLGEEVNDAIQLIKRPLKLMGYEISSDLAIRILAETNYYPSLIQIFCGELVKYLQNASQARYVRNDAKQGSESLIERICPEDIDAILDKPDLREQIRYRFMLTLELDLRYEVIALNIAYHAGIVTPDDTQDNLVNGYSLSWILDKCQRWAALFGKRVLIDDIRSLCDELVELGILRVVSMERLTLRSVNILNMLGTQESIDRKLRELEDKQYDYSAMYNMSLNRGIFDERISEDLAGYAYPLANQQLTALLGSPGLKLVTGTRALEIDHVIPCLHDFLTLSSEYQEKYVLRIFERQLPQADDLTAGALCVVPPSCDWTPEDLFALKQALERSDAADKLVIVLLCDERKTYRLLTDAPELPDMTVIQMNVWMTEAVQFWLSEQASSHPLLNEDIELITRRLCGWPQAIYQFRKVLVSQRSAIPHVSELLDQTVERLKEDGSLLASLLRGAEMDGLERNVLQTFREYQTDISCEDMPAIMEGCPDVTLERVRLVMRWMERQGLLRRIVVEEDRTAQSRSGTRRDNERYVADELLLELLQ